MGRRGKAEDEGFESLSLQQDGLMPTPLPGAFISPWILPRAIKQSTGLFDTPVCGLVPPFRIPNPMAKKKHTRMGVLLFWQRMRDSNPRERGQSPVCYRYTNPLCWDYYTQIFVKVKKSFCLFQTFSSQGKGLPVRTSSFRYRKVASSPWSRSMVRIWRSCFCVLGCIRSRSMPRSK